MRSALKDADPNVRSEGRRLLSRVRPEEAWRNCSALWRKDKRSSGGGAFAILGDMKGSRVDAELTKWLDKLLAGEVAPKCVWIYWRLRRRIAAGHQGEGATL